MQLTASRSHAIGPWARAARALSRHADAPAATVSLGRSRPASQAATLSRRSMPPPAAPWAGRRTHGAVALAISAGLHVVFLAAWRAVSPAIAPAPLAPALESQVVHVHIAPRAKSGNATLDPGKPRTRIAAAPSALAAPISGRVDRSPAPVPSVAQSAAQGEMQAQDREDPTSPPPASTIAEVSAGPAAAAASGRAAAVAPQPAPAAGTPAYLDAPEPEYPRSAREDDQEGLVVLRVLVSRQGLPAEIGIARSSGFRALDAAAVAAVKRWTFSPARLDDRDIDSWMDVPIRFRLQ